MKLVNVIQGILDRRGRRRPSWPWEFKAWAGVEGLRVICEAEHYKALPLPRINTWWRNPFLAKEYVNRLLMYNEHPDEPGKQRFPISLVGHSNGADIALRMAKRFAAAGQTVDELVLIGAAVESDLVKSGIDGLLNSGRLKRVFAYWNPSDLVTRYLEVFRGGYGAMGGVGLMRGDREAGVSVAFDAQVDPGARVVNRRWDDFGHNGYFDAENIERVFRCLAKDLGLSRERICKKSAVTGESGEARADLAPEGSSAKPGGFVPFTSGFESNAGGGAPVSDPPAPLRFECTEHDAGGGGDEFSGGWVPEFQG